MSFPSFTGITTVIRPDCLFHIQHHDMLACSLQTIRDSEPSKQEAVFLEIPVKYLCMLISSYGQPQSLNDLTARINRVKESWSLRTETFLQASDALFDGEYKIHYFAPGELEAIKWTKQFLRDCQEADCDPVIKISDNQVFQNRIAEKLSSFEPFDFLSQEVDPNFLPEFLANLYVYLVEQINVGQKEVNCFKLEELIRRAKTNAQIYTEDVTHLYTKGKKTELFYLIIEINRVKKMCTYTSDPKAPLFKFSDLS